MKAHIQFLTYSTGYTENSIPPRFDSIPQPQPKLGSDGIRILDGRQSLSTMVATGHEALAKNTTLCGFEIREGNRAREGKLLYQYTHRRNFALNCKLCEDEKSRNITFRPSHNASRHCESGSHPHCTCDFCF